MTDTDTPITLSMTNAARMVLNAIATEVGPLRDAELFLAGCEVLVALRQIPNLYKVGEKDVDIPAALHGTDNLPPESAQRLGVLQLADQWKVLKSEVKLPARLVAVLKLQVQYILENQSRGTRVGLPLDPACAEIVSLLR